LEHGFHPRVFDHHSPALGYHRRLPARIRTYLMSIVFKLPSTYPKPVIRLLLKLSNLAVAAREK
jgi:hypothetical protein